MRESRVPMNASVDIVAVTGASGFVGGWVMRKLRECPGVTPVSFFENGGDITDAALVRRRMSELKPRALIHLAAVAAPGTAKDNPKRAFAVNLGGTLHLAEAIRDQSPSTRLVFAGSSEAYGRSFNLGQSVDEGSLLAPGSIYGVTKASADLLLGQMAADGLDVTRFRPFNHTGPGQSETYVVASFARQIAQIEAQIGPAVLRVGNLEAERDFLDVRDVADAYVRAALRRESLPAGAVMNLASGKARRIGDILMALMSRSSVQIEVQPDPARMRPSEIARAVGSAQEAQRLLGWKPTIDWERTLDDTLDDWRARVLS